MNMNDILPQQLNVNDAIDLLAPVAVYILGMAAYAFFIFKFYRFVASRDMFQMDLSRYEESRYKVVRGFLHIVMYVAKYLILFPAIAFFWFAVLTVILAFLSKEQPFSEVLLTALATVCAIRISAYYNEDLSKDLAKILPFAVLAIFLIDASFFSVRESSEVLKEARDHTAAIIYCLLFLVAMEFVLRVVMGGFAFLFAIKARIIGGRGDAT